MSSSRSLTQSVTTGVSWLGVAQVLQRATTLVVTAVLARQLFPEDFGLIALTLLTVNVISYFQDMGLSAALVQRPEVESDHLSTTFWLNLSAGLLLGAAGIVLAPLVATIFREPRLTSVLIAALIILPINGLGWTSYALLQRRLAFKEIAVIEWTSTLLSGVVAIVLALSGAGVWALIAQNVVGAIVSSSGRLLAAGWLPNLSFNMGRAKELFSFSSGALGYFVVNHGMRNIDNAIVGGVLGTAALGYYSLAYNLILMPGMTVCGLVGRVMFPALSSVQKDLSRFRRAYLRMARTVALITFPLILGLGATAPIFIRTIYGDRWAPAVPIVQILIVVGFFEAIAIWGPAAWALGRTKTTVVLAGISLLVMIIAFAIGVRWGLAGVAWAYVFISPIVFVLPHLWTNRLMELRFGKFLRAVAPPFCAAGIMGLVIVVMTTRGIQLSASRWANLTGYVIFGGCLYIALVACIAFLNRQQQGMISWLIGREASERQPEGVTL
ncbi:MAG: lipopolysaccharide biosynthesis protein [Pyrinomonadaceae bacterium]